MQYRINHKNGDRLSALGFGCMRFGRDEAEVTRQIAYAVEQGVNYFDTAYVYPGSEAALGRAIEAGGFRDRVRIATKVPPYFVTKREDLDRLLYTSLRRLRTDHIDYGLIHMLTSPAEWQRLVEMDVHRWVEDKKRSGEIVNLGFSYHGGTEDYIGLIDAYDWDFTMLQYNYLDEFSQAGRRGLTHAYEKGVPIMVMEPLRGGRLVDRLPPEALGVFAESGAERSPADWGLRWVWNHPEVLTVLSGMNSMAMIEENIRVAADALPGSLSGEDLARYARVRNMILEVAEVSCTGCGYCMPCPFGVDIPLCFSALSDRVLIGGGKARLNYITRVGGAASRCTGCGKCETHCPQQIPIRADLKRVVRVLEGPLYKPLKAGVDWAMKRK